MVSIFVCATFIFLQSRGKIITRIRSNWLIVFGFYVADVKSRSGLCHHRSTPRIQYIDITFKRKRLNWLVLFLYVTKQQHVERLIWQHTEVIVGSIVDKLKKNKIFRQSQCTDTFSYSIFSSRLTPKFTFKLLCGSVDLCTYLSLCETRRV